MVSLLQMFIRVAKFFISQCEQEIKTCKLEESKTRRIANP